MATMKEMNELLCRIQRDAEQLTGAWLMAQDARDPRERLDEAENVVSLLLSIGDAIKEALPVAKAKVERKLRLQRRV